MQKKKYSKSYLNSKKNGITLIALIITIIVLLILAGVSLTALVGDNGIINQAIKGKEKTKEASVKEELEMAWVAQLSKYYEDVSKGKISNTIEAFESYFSEAKLNPLLKNGVISQLSHNRTQKAFAFKYTAENEEYTIKISDNGKIGDIITLASTNAGENTNTVENTNGNTNNEEPVEEEVIEEPVVEEPGNGGTHHTVAREITYDNYRDLDSSNGDEIFISVGGVSTDLWYYGDKKELIVSQRRPYQNNSSEIIWRFGNMDFTSFDNIVNIDRTTFQEVENGEKFEDYIGQVEKIIFKVDVPLKNFKGFSSVTKIEHIKSGYTVTSLKGFFEGCSSLTSVDLAWINFNNITDYTDAFKGCTSLEKIYVNSSMKLTSSVASTILQDCATDHFTIRYSDGSEISVYPADLVE